jgi:hypothetical protein
VIDCSIDKIILNSNAVQNESTAKPPTIFVHNKIITAFMTSKNKPSVITVTGSVNMIRIGFIKRFSNPKTTATIRAVPKLATDTPFKRLDSSKTKAAVTRSLSINFMVFGLNSVKNTAFLIMISKRQSSIRKTFSDFRHEASVLHLESSLILNPENAVLSHQHPNPKYNLNFLHG